MRTYSVRPTITLLLLVQAGFATGQIIGDVKHESFQDKVIITYNLNGLAENRQLSVNVYCSDDGFNQNLTSVSGNGIGASVQGNGQKTIVWDVLRERQELVGPIRFELRALVTERTAGQTAGTREVVALSEEEKKTEVYGAISAVLGNYLIEAKDLVTAFRMVDDNIFNDNLKMRQITDAVINYNAVFNRLNNERMNFEKQVLMLWNNEALYNDVRYLFDYALGDVHAINVLELNRSLNLINDINLGRVQGRKNEKEARTKVIADVFQNTGQLDKRIQELERRASRILYTLSNR
jgi:hypothetical protein